MNNIMGHTPREFFNSVREYISLVPGFSPHPTKRQNEATSYINDNRCGFSLQPCLPEQGSQSVIKSSCPSRVKWLQGVASKVESKANKRLQRLSKRAHQDTVAPVIVCVERCVWRGRCGEGDVESEVWRGGCGERGVERVCGGCGEVCVKRRVWRGKLCIQLLTFHKTTSWEIISPSFRRPSNTGHLASIFL